MRAAKLSIDGEDVSIGAVWAHWKAPPKGPHSTFLLRVGGEFVIEVFDQWRQKPSEQAWEDYILNNLITSGTAALAHYLEVLRRIDSVNKEPWEWVITRVQEVSAAEEGILLRGTAEKFDPRRVPVVVPLR